jgi:hypothetical protein
MTSDDRRAPGATRIPLEGLVEVGGAIGPTFEAQAVNVSEEGLQLRSAYLPEPGQPLTCRFDVGAGQSVLAAGEVAWARGAERGGELGIRFTDMDPESIDALKRLCGSAGGASAAASAPAPGGQKVRLHIDGLASPMRAKIRDSRSTEITVGSDLGFLQVGKQLELEDAQSGTKRPASIDCVEVVVDPASHVPQLVVTLRYADVDVEVDTGDGASGVAERAERAAGAHGADGTQGRARVPSSARNDAAPAAEARRADDLAAVEDASLKMKGTLAHNIGRLGPALERFASQAWTTVALLAKRRRERAGGDDGAPRRTTAPAPGGGLHTSGRRVVRGEASGGDESPPAAAPRLKLTKRRAAVVSAVMISAVLGAIAIKKSHHEVSPEGATAPGAASAAASVAAVAASPASATGAVPPQSTAAAPAYPPAPALDPGSSFGAMSAPTGAMSSLDDESASSSHGSHKKRVRVAPFGNGPVHHGNILHLQMDGPIESLEGAQQPTGFAVKIPGRKSLEAAGPLASRDGRIAAMKVSNDAGGAELTVTFRDGVPNYQVSARGDTLVIALAPAGALEKTAKKDDSLGNPAKHGKPTREAHEAHESRDARDARDARDGRDSRDKPKGDKR